MEELYYACLSGAKQFLRNVQVPGRQGGKEMGPREKHQRGYLGSLSERQQSNAHFTTPALFSSFLLRLRMKR
jgi:hypothetical protein